MKSMEELNKMFGTEQVLKMLELTERVKSIDLDALKTPAERFAISVRAGETIGRKLKKAKVRKKPKQSRATRLRKRREWVRLYFSPKLKEREAKMWETGDTWGIASRAWTPKNSDVTQEEWQEHIAPALAGRVFTVNRYATKERITLGNLLVVDSDTKEVLFDGKEYILRKLGYIL